MFCDFAIRLTPIDDKRFGHEGYVRCGRACEEIPPRIVEYAQLPEQLCVEINADSPDPWIKTGNGRPNLVAAESMLAELFDPHPRPTRATVDQLKPAVLEYGQWLFRTIVLGRQDDLYDRFTRCSHDVLASSDASLRILLEISRSADQQSSGTTSDTLSNLTFELIAKDGNCLLRNKKRILYRVPDIDVFAANSEPVVSRHPRAFVGVAGPDNCQIPTLPLFTIFELLEGITPRPGREPTNPQMSGCLDMRLSDTTIGSPSPHRSDLVVVVAHGEQNEDGFVLVLNSGDSNDPCEVPIGALGDFLAACHARLAVFVCCQPRHSTGGIRNDLGAVLLASASDHLSGIVCFRARVAWESARAFIGSLAQDLDRAGWSTPFELTSAVGAARHSINKYNARHHEAQWDFAIPAVHVRRDFALHKPPQDDEQWVKLLGETAYDFRVRTGDEYRALGGNIEEFIQPRRRATPPQADRIQEIARFPVTRGEFRELIEIDRWPEQHDDDLPATRLTWELIKRFLDKQNENSPDNVEYSLPKLSDWIRAAYSGCVSFFPWGDSWEADKAKTRGRLVSVFDTWEHESGVFGMIGNCWELLGEGTPPNRIIGGDCRSESWQCTACCRKHVSLSSADGLEIGIRLLRVRKLDDTP